MGFSNKRGRPKKAKPVAGGKEEIDLGTAELQKKRRRNLTLEPIDICRSKGLIDEAEHSAALHFRWLYTLRFGAAGISALDLTSLNGREIRDFDEGRQAEREREYAAAVEKLRGVGALKVVMNTVIFNHKPKFLTRSTDLAQIKLNASETAKLREGLSVLAAPKRRRNDMENRKLR